MGNHVGNSDPILHPIWGIFHRRRRGQPKAGLGCLSHSMGRADTPGRDSFHRHVFHAVLPPLAGKQRSLGRGDSYSCQSAWWRRHHVRKSTSPVSRNQRGLTLRPGERRIFLSNVNRRQNLEACGPGRFRAGVVSTHGNECVRSNTRFRQPSLRTNNTQA